MCQEIIWKPIVGFEELYEVSTSGEVRSVDREFSYYNPRLCRYTPRHIKSKPMKTYDSIGGYKFISLRKDGKYYQRYVHRLVAQTFIDNPENKPEVNHKDRNKHNNCVDNLEWVTSKENSQHLLHSDDYDWGAASRGRHPSAETRAKISASCKGHTGYVHTAETRAKLLKSRYNPVRCITDGKMFACARDADRYYGYNGTVAKNIKLNRATRDGKRFEYIPKELYYVVDL